jgi:hypothetical protein
MQVRTPVVTLLAGSTLAAALLGLSVRDNREKTAALARASAAQPAQPGAAQPGGAKAGGAKQDGAKQGGTKPAGAPAPGRTSPPPPAQPGRPAPSLNVTWAGPAERGTSIAIVAKGASAVAYLCDGTRIEAWLQGSATNGRLNLSGAGNARLTGTFSGKRAAGAATVGGQRFDFDVPAISTGTRLWRATRNVRGAQIVAGWIVLPNGRQVGLATVNGTETKPSALDVATGAAKVGDVAVTAIPVQPDGAR